VERIYLDIDDVLSIHARQIELFGGSPGVRDLGLIESALLRPQTGYYSDLIEEAAALWESLAMNHGFIDGNKRVAFACTYAFLASNGTRIVAESKQIIEFVLGHLEAGTFAKDNLDAWLRSNTKAA
jgi:death-on-curing protein